ncbi:MAG: transketolase C-terminal domain-containing protein [Chthoniobacteraceae bacterium]
MTGPIAIRYPRGAGTGAKPKDTPKLLEIGKSEVLKHGKTVAIFGLGNFCSVALETAKLLEAQGISTAVINPRWIKPLDTGTLEFFARSVDVICTMEDHVVHNGYGTGIIEHLADAGINDPGRARRVARPVRRARCGGHPAQEARPHRPGRGGENPGPCEEASRVRTAERGVGANRAEIQAHAETRRRRDGR